MRQHRFQAPDFVRYVYLFRFTDWQKWPRAGKHAVRAVSIVSLPIGKA